MDVQKKATNESRDEKKRHKVLSSLLGGATEREGKRGWGGRRRGGGEGCIINGGTVLPALYVMVHAKQNKKNSHVFLLLYLLLSVQRL